MTEIHLTLSTPKPLSVQIGEQPSITITIGKPVSIGGGIPYDGPYDVDPDFVGKKLLTAGKSMLHNVNVHPITVSRTGNDAGGKTIYIGGVING